MNKKVSMMTRCALCTCMLCIVAQIVITLPTMIPITLQTFGLYLIALSLNPKESFIICLLYVIIGAIGLPVFSGFGGGLGSLLGPAGGYIYSFPIMALVIGCVSRINGKSNIVSVLACVSGTVVCYSIGTLWFMYVTQNSFIAALTYCVFPFLLGDAIKIGIAQIISRKLVGKLRVEV